MPEGDTVFRTAHRLNQALAGDTLTRSDLRWPELSTLDFRGVRTTEVVSHGKNILHRLESGVTIHSHLRMEGQWRVESTQSLTRRQLSSPQLRAVLGTATWTALGTRLGELHVLATAEEDHLLGHLGPDVLGADWDPEEAARRLRLSPTTIGAALLDQRNLAGVGTLYASETFFLERLNPWTRAADLDEATTSRVVDRAHTLLDLGRRHAVQATTGNSRRGETAWVHGRSGRPCRRCGGTVRVAMVGEPPRERTMFYCPGCQGGLAPTDEGRPQSPLGTTTRGGPPLGDRSGRQ